MSVCGNSSKHYILNEQFNSLCTREDSTMANNVQLDFAVEQFKSQMAKSKQNKSDDWKKAYLNRIDKQKQSLNKSEQYRREA